MVALQEPSCKTSRMLCELLFRQGWEMSLIIFYNQSRYGALQSVHVSPSNSGLGCVSDKAERSEIHQIEEVCFHSYVTT